MYKILLFVSCLLLCLLALASADGGHEFYVSPSGNDPLILTNIPAIYPYIWESTDTIVVLGSDANSGTISHPFATLARAKKAVREAKTSWNGPINVYFREGTVYAPI